MLFAAFEKKWWKALIGDQDTMPDNKEGYPESDLRNSFILVQVEQLPLKPSFPLISFYYITFEYSY